MLAYAIVLKDNEISEFGFSILKRSSSDVGNLFPIKRFNACNYLDAQKAINDNEIVWNYPLSGTEFDGETGLLKSAYFGQSIWSRIGCFLSHYRLWQKCIELNEELMILEHDVVFIKAYHELESNRTGPFILGLNDPRGATRRSQFYHETIQNSTYEIQSVPTIDDMQVPQGLAGNSAYIINVEAAKELLVGVKKYGAWPNDALMCKQLFSFLRVSKTYYTRVQGLPSTTS